MKDKVLGTIPPANQTSAITNEITIVVGSGPESRPVPDVKGQTVDSAQQILTASGFTKVVPVEVDSTVAERARSSAPFRLPDRLVPLDTRDPDPGVAGQPVRHARRARAGSGPTSSRTCARYGWTGPLIRGPDVQNSGQRTNAVVTQSPAPGTAVKFGDPITLSFAS